MIRRQSRKSPIAPSKQIAWSAWLQRWFLAAMCLLCRVLLSSILLFGLSRWLGVFHGSNLHLAGGWRRMAAIQVELIRIPGDLP
jgi:hypothetical protein